MFEMTLQQIQQRIVQVWPDLPPGQPDWTLIMGHCDSFDKFNPPLDEATAAFIIKADADVNQDQFQRSVFLLSLRSWNLATGSFVPTVLRAFVMDTQMVISEFFAGLDFHQRCDLSPCALEHNGRVISPWHHQFPLRIFDGDYIQVHGILNQGLSL